MAEAPFIYSIRSLQIRSDSKTIWLKKSCAIKGQIFVASSGGWLESIHENEKCKVGIDARCWATLTIEAENPGAQLFKESTQLQNSESW